VLFVYTIETGHLVFMLKIAAYMSVAGIT